MNTINTHIFKDKEFQYTIKRDGTWVFEYLYISNEGLISLSEFFKDLPEKVEVKGDFYCSCNELKTLKGLPKGFKVGNDFYCFDNQLKTLEGLPKGFKVGRDFYCTHNELKTLKGLPEGFKVGRDFVCSYNQLKTLEGCPKGFKVGNLYCDHNPIKDIGLAGLRIERLYFPMETQ